ncbi:MAG: glutamate racemase [Bacteroidales bacterium]
MESTVMKSRFSLKVNGILVLIAVLLTVLTGCKSSDRRTLPIGMFDSGTGGLTVLEQFLAMDSFNNKTGEENPDGIPDFGGENFTYLADQANMPYGVYSSKNKTDFLKELIINDAKFLTTGKNSSKIVVIACNTATAYGFKDVEEMLLKSGKGVKVIGVINAGVDGALSTIPFSNGVSEERFAIGVMATVGTIASGGYENTIQRLSKERGFKGELKVVNQGGLGFAEAIDSEIDYISKEATGTRENYRGPRYGDSTGIDPLLMDLYNFDTSGNSLLVKRDNEGKITDVQLNSTGNYARFHMVSLLEKHRRSNPGVKLKSIILGCTHYPYLIDTIIKVEKELKAKEINGEYPYKAAMDSVVKYIDPAVNTAKETFRLLLAMNLLKNGETESKVSPFISVPAKNIEGKNLDKNGNFTFEFKYGRELGSGISTVDVVPFSKSNINQENIKRIGERLPLSYSLIKTNLE